MAVTVVNNLSVFTDGTNNSDAEGTTGWTSDGPGISLFSGFQREGSGCLGAQISQETAHFWFSCNSTDVSNERIYAWMFIWGSLDTKVNGGLRIVLGDGTNRVAYYVGGSDDYGHQVGGWTCVVLDTANLPSGSAQLLGSAAPTLTAITEVGIGAVYTNKATGNTENFFFDVVRHGLGLTVYGGTSGDPGTFAEIAADDRSSAAGKAYGVIRELQAGVYGVQGDIQFGDNAGTNDFYFKDSSSTVVIEDRVHGAGTPTDMRFDVVGNATATTQHYELGIAVGTGDDESGRNGVTFVNANIGGQPVVFDASDVDLDDVLLFGCNLVGIEKTGVTQPIFSNDATLGPTHRLSGVTFDRCGQVDLGQVVARQCIFTGHTGTDAALLWNANIDIKNSQFIANTDATNSPAGVEHPATGTFTYVGLTFSGNDFDIYNSSGGSVTIDATSGSNPSTHRTPAGSTTINNAVTHTVTGLTTGSRVVWIRVSDDAELANKVESSGQASFTYNYSGDFDVDVQILSLDELNKLVRVTLGSTDATLPASQSNDPFFSNPV